MASKLARKHLFPKPEGLQCLLRACAQHYPKWQNPPRFIPIDKVWQRGQYPLLCVYVFLNLGDPNVGIAAHWHYIGFGLSDLHGDGRFHDISEMQTRSGYGIELTFRLKKTPDDEAAPEWPVSILQVAAQVVFQTKKVLCPGDVLRPISRLGDKRYRMQNWLRISEDHQLGTVETSFGSVKFLQIVGPYGKDMEIAWQGKKQHLIQWMISIKGVGGPSFIEDLEDDEAIFEVLHLPLLEFRKPISDLHCRFSQVNCSEDQSEPCSKKTI